MGNKKSTAAPFAPLPVSSIHYHKTPGTQTEDKALGIVYDWNAVNRAYKALGCPAGVYDPTTAPISTCGWTVLMSARSCGKTTNWLLYAMCWQRLYKNANATIAYVRRKPEMIERKALDNATGLFTVIRSFDYIQMITEGEWNGVNYYAGAWRYVLLNEEGKIEKRDERPFMQCFDLAEQANYKSTVNAPALDLCIFDEFIDQVYFQNEFTDYLCEALKTFFRDRISSRVILLGNGVRPRSHYMTELMISKRASVMQEGDHFIHTTKGGTSIYCESVSFNPELKKRRALSNSMFFGFDNERLVTITGGAVWRLDNVPHIRPEKDDPRRMIARGAYLRYQEITLALDLYESENVNLEVLVHPCNGIPNAAKRVFTLDEITDKREAYRFGVTDYDKLLWSLYKVNRWYYSSNDDGEIVRQYVEDASKI